MFEIIAGFLSFALFGLGYYLISKKKKTVTPITHKTDKKTDEVTWETRLQKGLSLSREGVWQKLSSLLGSKENHQEEIEEILYSADVPPYLVEELITKLATPAKGKSMEAVTEDLFDFLKQKFFLESKETPVQKSPKVIMIVGVNGAGKTTTIGKLATKFREQGKSVIIGACDTFRAAAVEQLQVWCDRSGAEMIRAKDGADPSGVAYDTVAKAYAQKNDICIIDTAGRLHNNKNLMDELTKMKRVMTKIDADAPHETWLVIDAISGQNALKQALEFHKALNLTGLILTKCDGSSKAGSAIGIVDQLKVPIVYMGVGEGVEDLNQFDPDLYLGALLGFSKQSMENKHLN